MRILKALLKKEISLLRRNPLIPKMIIAMPIMVMLVIPLVADLDVKEVNVAVIDQDHSQLSRRMVSDMSSTGTLHISSMSTTFPEAMRLVEDGQADVVVNIPYEYEKSLGSGMKEIDIEANGVNATKGMLGAQYVSKSIAGTLNQWMTEKGVQLPESYISVINKYNPTLNFRNYMIPALMVVLIIVICGFLPTLNLVNEKESGTIEAMNVTPVKPLTFILSKLIPFWVVGLFVVFVGMLIGRAVYGLAPAGSIGAIFLASFLFSLVMSGLGLIIANQSATMLQSIFTTFAFVMIFQLMSGLFTPITSMPEWAQCVTYFVPPRYYIEIMRSLYLKGASISDLWFQFSCLGGFAILLCTGSALTYRKQS